MHDVMTPAGRTLASLAPGESATVHSIAFGVLRALCRDLGIREGAGVHCRAGTAGVLVLDTADGHTVSLARDWARFIRLTPAAAPGDQPAVASAAESADAVPDDEGTAAAHRAPLSA
jgi:hypothetical protein